MDVADIGVNTCEDGEDASEDLKMRFSLVVWWVLLEDVKGTTCA